MTDCPGHCDHCAPDMWHDCVRPRGHGGWHSCDPVPGDYSESDEEEL